MSYLTEKEHKAMQACLLQAEDLLNAAKASLEKDIPQIAYNLASLALEEIGKRELIKIQPVARTKEETSGWLEKGQSDHLIKLFWSIFGGNFTDQEITPEYVQNLQDFAGTTYEKRLKATYVDEKSDEIVLPRDTISTEEAEHIISFCEARLELAKSEKRRKKIPKKDMESQRWFLKACQNPEMKKFVFSKKSFKKLKELSDHKEWVSWLKDEFERMDVEQEALLQKELERAKNLPSKGGKDKWKVRARIYSSSHTIRPQALKEWNDQVEWLKLYPAGSNKDEIIAEIIMKDDIPLQAVWHMAYGLLRAFLVALNISTMGFWWWYPCKRTDNFYESFEDLENKQKLEIGPQQPMNLLWPEKVVLKSEQMRGVMSYFSKLPTPPKINEHEELNCYLAGVTFLGLRSPHWDSRDSAFTNFAKSLEGQLSKGYSGSFPENFQSFLDDHFKDAEDIDRAIELIDHHVNGTELTEPINTKDLIQMKLMCDSAFILFLLEGKRIS